MKFSNCLRITLLLIMPFSFSYANQPAQPAIDESIMAQMAEQRQDKLEFILKLVIDNANTLDIILEDIALDVNNKAIQTDKAKAIAAIKELRAFTSAIKNDAFADINEPTLAILLQLEKHLITHFKNALDKGLHNIPSFQVPRSALTEDDITFENLMKAAQENSVILELVKEQAKTAGLTWYNKLYRKLDDNVLQPAHKYHLDKVAMVGGITGLLALYCWYQSDSKNTSLRNILGWPPRLDNAGNLNDIYHNGLATEQKAVEYLKQVMKAAEMDDLSIDLYLQGEQSKKEIAALVAGHPLKWYLGVPEHFIRRYGQGYWPFATVLVPLALTAYKSAFVQAKNAVGKQLTKAVNFLKGGEYRNRPDGVTDMQSKVNFDNVVGKEHAKEIAYKILKYLEDPERFARKNLIPEKGYLLYGPTRTGKSHFAKALCGEIQKLMRAMGKPADEFGFYEIKADKISEAGFDYIMHLAQEAGPCVIFIDEIDLLDLQRIGNKNMLSQFLSTLSGFMDTDPKKQVILLAATNKPENIDFALRQHGRFGKSIFFDLPTLENRIEFLCKRLGDLSVDIAQFDVEKLALETTGCTYEDINAIIKAAFQKSKILGVTLSQELLEMSFDEEVRNIIGVDEKQITDKEMAVIATHQAAAALTHVLLETEDKVAKVTIQPIVAKLKEESVWMQYHDQKNEAKQSPIIYGKVFTYRENDTLNVISNTEKMAQCKLLLAGAAAEKMLLGSTGGSYHSGYRQQALNIAQSIAFEGIDPQQLPKQRVQELRTAALQILAACEQEIIALLESNKDALTALVAALKERKSLSGQEVAEIVKKK